MADVKWIKITTDMFDDEKIDFISSLPEGDALLVIWIRLLTMAGKCNAGGYIFLTESIPYTDDMMAHKFKKPLNIVRMAIETFARLGMVQIEDGKLILTNWAKHQNVEGMDKIREQTRQRVARHRAEVKQIGNATSNVTVTQGNAIDIEPDKEKEKKKNKKVKHKYGSFSNVLLTDEEINRLNSEYGEQLTKSAIEFFSQYIVEKDYTSKDHNLTIRRWVFKAIGKNQQSQSDTDYPGILL